MAQKFPAILLLAVALAPAGAQEALNPPVPFTVAAADATSVGGNLVTLGAARSAQEMGMPSVAASLYRQLLAAPPGAGGDRAQITLALTTALLDEGDVTGAAQALLDFPGPHGGAWHLRTGLVMAYQKRLDAARADFADVKREELEPADVSWWLFLQGMIANIGGDTDRSLRFYDQAQQSALSETARSRFRLASYEARLRLGTVAAKDIEEARKKAAENQGTLGYMYTRDYAIMLDAGGIRNEAINVLQRQLPVLPAQARREADSFRLLLGLIAGAGDGVGRNALGELLATGSDPELQRIALQLLAQASQDGPRRADFQSRLNVLINTQAPHPILPELLLFRAEAALSGKSSEGRAQAETDAKNLLQKFPGSPLKARALGVLTSVAWEQSRYRTAADYAEKSRAELPPTAHQTHAELGVLVAEAWYRAALNSREAGDFRSAAEAYGAALRDQPQGVAPGALMFQRVLAEIKAAQSEPAPAQASAELLAVQTTLDGFVRDPAFDATNHWEAEWNLARALQIAGQTETAFARVNQLLAAQVATPGPVLPPELRVRMEWLQARLSLDAGQPEQTLKLAQALLAARGGQNADLHSETVLLQAQADFALRREADAAAILKGLRDDFGKSDAAARSYIVEADYNAGQDRIVEAQRLLTKLAEDPDFKNSDYAPQALYRAALLAKRRGQEKDLAEANQLIEQLVTGYPHSEFVFTARLEQGDLFRQRNDFPAAELTYQRIVEDFPQHPGVSGALLALADCHSAQAAADPTHAQRAEEIYERLLALPGALPDLRVEAGFKLGYAKERKGDPDGAQNVWLRDVVKGFLLDETRAAELGATGRYWMARTLLELGDLLEKQGKFDEARTTWQRIQQANLPGAADAKAKLASLNPSGAKP